MGNEEDSQEENEYYEWTMIPHCSDEENKNGVTIKGDTPEYLEARDKIFELFNKKGQKLKVNNRELRVSDNAVNKPFRIEVKPPKGQTGKVNLKIYGANKAGIATFMITKTKDAKLVHVKTLAFRVIKYLIDGIIDGVIKEDDLESFKDKNSKNDEEGLDIEKKLKCESCRKIYKTKNGLSIHMDKVHGVQEQNICDFCEQIFDTGRDLEIHNKKEHEPKGILKCEKCNFTFQDDEVLNKHITKCGDKKLTLDIEDSNMKCDYCDLKIWAGNEVEVKQKLLKHHLVCGFIPKRSQEIQEKYCCKECDFVTHQEDQFKRHRRDNHGALNVSTSPKPKRRKHYENIENMEVEEANDEETKMEVDETKDILIERSKRWDEKIKRRNEKYEEEERRYVKEKEEKELQENKRKEKEKKESEKCKKVKSKSKKKSGKKEMKPFLREIPQSLKNLIGENYFIYPVAGDGACGLRAVAAAIFQDPSEGPYLGRNINAHFVKHWQYWKNFFTFPFEREIGNEGIKMIKSEKELFEFFENSNKGAFMWRDHEDFAAISNIYQVRIKIITFRNTQDLNPLISIVDPDPKFKLETESELGKIPDIILYHLKDVHYDLVIPKGCRIAEEGCLDLQRKENVINSEKDIKMVEEKEETRTPSLSEEKAILLDRIRILEEKLNYMEKKVDRLEEEKKEKMNYLCYKCDQTQIDKLKCSKCEVEIPSKEYVEEHVISHSSNQNNCEHCGIVFRTENLLENHMKEYHSESKMSRNQDQCEETGKLDRNLEPHIEGHEMESNFKCTKRSEAFPGKIDLKNHSGKNHTNNKNIRMRQFNCEDCSFQGENHRVLKNHIERTQHTPSKYKEICYTCEREFGGYKELMDHRKTEHPSTKSCRYFKKNECLFSTEDCWYRHEDSLEKDGGKTREGKFLEIYCQNCDEKFVEKKFLKDHMKQKHLEMVAKCWNYKNDKCHLPDNKCWFKHEEKTDQMNKISEEKIENIPKQVENTEKVFHDVQEKTPPDHINQILQMITNLSFQVKNLTQT